MRCVCATPSDFAFESAVCAYGYFALAPNQWLPAQGELETVLPVGDSAILVRVRGGLRNGKTIVNIHAPCLPSAERNGSGPSKAQVRDSALQAIRRMLRLDEDLSAFHDACRADAATARAADVRFGRLIRGATLFEDIVKTMCTCNITWRQTLTIVDKLVQRYGESACNDPSRRAFPTAEALASVSEAKLRRNCGLGYRAEWVRRLALGVADGSIDLTELERSDLTTDDLHKRLRTIHGVGDYAASTLCMLLGRYDRVAVDTEMIRHYKQRFPRRRCTPAMIRRHYDRYAPFSYLAYWWELCSTKWDEDGRLDAWITAVLR